MRVLFSRLFPNDPTNPSAKIFPQITMAKKKQQPSVNSSSSSEKSSSSNDEKPTKNESSSEATDYEKQRQSRIASNKARMEALGLRNLANSFMGSSQNHRKGNLTPKSKRVVKKEVDDDEYEPIVESSSDGGSDGSTDEDFDQEEMIDRRRNRKSSSKKSQVKNVKSKSGKKVSVRNARDVPDFMDEDEALKQAIALSLKDSVVISDLQCGGSSEGSGIRQKSHQVETTKGKKRKPFTSRVQMTEDDLVVHFCLFDEVGKGSITLRDVERMAATHDFVWTDKELSDMIRCFDSDRDGKLSLDDFRNIVQRCNMLQKQEDT